ncbi:hypothetical protein [Cupriavidus pauculus]|uniref:hypothetical protein n=1 Tax=Cupriavidus pauculus TaxID=82633 RepID=UPI001D0CA3F3
MSLKTPLEEALGAYMGRYYTELVADTPAMEEYIARGLRKSIVWVPGRMIDSVQDMLNEYRKNANEDGPGLSSKLPVVFVCLSKDFQPALPDFGVAAAAPLSFRSPADEHGRIYKVRASINEYRAQLAFIAPEGGSAGSLALQFHLYANANRRFHHGHHFAGQTHNFPAVLENIDIGAVSVPTDQKNLTILVADMTVRATIPMFQAPKPGEPNDGKPAPSGYPVVVNISADDLVAKSGSDTFIDQDGNKKAVFR